MLTVDVPKWCTTNYHTILRTIVQFFSVNCQTLKWVKSPYACSDSLSNSSPASSSNASSYCCITSSPSWYPRIPRRQQVLLPICHITGNFKTQDVCIYPGQRETNFYKNIRILWRFSSKYALGRIYRWASVRGFSGRALLYHSIAE